MLYTLLFDFLDYTTGRLDPSYDAIAAKAGVCRRAVVNAVRRLKELGLLHWQRRCREDKDEAGRFRLTQETNAYAVLYDTRERSGKLPAHVRAAGPQTRAHHSRLRP